MPFYVSCALTSKSHSPTQTTCLLLLELTTLANHISKPHRRGPVSRCSFSSLLFRKADVCSLPQLLTLGSDTDHSSLHSLAVTSSKRRYDRLDKSPERANSQRPSQVTASSLLHTLLSSITLSICHKPFQILADSINSLRDRTTSDLGPFSYQ